MMAFCKPRRLKNRYGDTRVVWLTIDRRYKVVRSTGIAGIAMPEHFFAIRLCDDGSEFLISRHRKRGAAMRAVARAAQPRKKVRR